MDVSSASAISCRLRSLVGDCKGGLMMEVVVAVTVFTLVGTAVLVGLSTAHTSGAATESQSIAENIGRNQMEYMLTLPYQLPPSIYATVEPHQGYSVTAVGEEYVIGGPNIERVIVTVSRG